MTTTCNNGMVESCCFVSTFDVVCSKSDKAIGLRLVTSQRGRDQQVALSDTDGSSHLDLMQNTLRFFTTLETCELSVNKNESYYRNQLQIAGELGIVLQRIAG